MRGCSLSVYVHLLNPETPPLAFLFFTVLLKQGSVFAFAVPLYSTESSSSGSASAAAAAGSGTNSGTNGQRDGDDGKDDTREARTVLDDPHIEFELYGNQFCFRAADRAGRKFKHKETIEL